MIVDLGLQPERTALAWTRTALAMQVNGILVLRAGLQASQPYLALLGLAITTLALPMAMAGKRRSRTINEAPGAARSRFMMFPAACVLLTAGAGTWALLI